MRKMSDLTYTIKRWIMSMKQPPFEDIEFHIKLISDEILYGHRA
jgi:hypothetical protein